MLGDETGRKNSAKESAVGPLQFKNKEMIVDEVFIKYSLNASFFNFKNLLCAGHWRSLVKTKDENKDLAWSVSKYA